MPRCHGLTIIWRTGDVVSHVFPKLQYCTIHFCILYSFVRAARLLHGVALCSILSVRYQRVTSWRSPPFFFPFFSCCHLVPLFFKILFIEKISNKQTNTRVVVIIFVFVICNCRWRDQQLWTILGFVSFFLGGLFSLEFSVFLLP